MDPAKFDTIKAELDAELNALPQDARVGIKMGLDLHTEFEDRKLLEPKEADPRSPRVFLPSYRGRFVYIEMEKEKMRPEAYKIGTPET